MLKHTFDFTLATYNSLAEVDPVEMKQADLIQIRGRVEKGIYHSRDMRWCSPLTLNADEYHLVRSKKEKKALKTNTSAFQEAGYEFKTVPLTEALFNEFKALYEQTTLKRDRALAIDLEDQILGKLRADMPVFITGMFKDTVLESGLALFIDKKQTAHVALGAKKKFPEFRGGVGGVLEIELVRFCQEKKLIEISHGRSMNPSGITGRSGIFEFKARYGYSAFPESYWLTTFVRSEKIALSDLIFVTLIDNQITYLVISRAPEHEVISKYKTTEVKHVQYLSMQDALSTTNLFISSL